MEIDPVRHLIVTSLPWKWADEVVDADLKTLVETVLDNEEVDVRDALGIFKNLPLEQQEQIALDEDDYKDLRNEDRGAIRDDVTNWSGWSPPYLNDGVVDFNQLPVDGAGVPISSPGPRRYFQFSVDLFSEDFESATAVGGLAFDVISPPYAEELIAEISPRTTEVGKRHVFSTRCVISHNQASKGVLITLRLRPRYALKRLEPSGFVMSTDRSTRLTFLGYR